METAASEVTLPTLAGALCGGALVVGVSLWALWLKKRRRQERDERPPQEEKILRPAGYFAMGRVEELGDRLTWGMVRAVLAGIGLERRREPFGR